MCPKKWNSIADGLDSLLEERKRAQETANVMEAAQSGRAFSIFSMDGMFYIISSTFRENAAVALHHPRSRNTSISYCVESCVRTATKIFTWLFARIMLQHRFYIMQNIKSKSFHPQRKSVLRSTRNTHGKIHVQNRVDTLDAPIFRICMSMCMCVCMHANG